MKDDKEGWVGATVESKSTDGNVITIKFKTEQDEVCLKNFLNRTRIKYYYPHFHHHKFTDHLTRNSLSKPLKMKSPTIARNFLP